MTADWKTYADYASRLEGDREWQTFLDELYSAKEPNADVVRTLLNVENFQLRHFTNSRRRRESCQVLLRYSRGACGRDGARIS
jgi:hypothetical protein